MYYVYVLCGKTSRKFYIGFTRNLKQRIKYHMRGKVYTTRRMKNIKLVYYEACLSKKDAMTREKQLKTGFGRGYLKRRLKNFLSEGL